ncbi:disease resistance TIR-NBS-LRR class family protein, partial [Tanacetum coccineum]
YLPKTFQANNLVGLEMEYSRRMVQLWEEEEKKVLQKLKFLNLCGSRLRSLDLELIPNLERLDLEDCNKLVEINAPVGCLKNFGFLRLTQFEFCSRSEPKVNCSSATLNLVGESLYRCPLHPGSNLPKFRFHCSYEEYLPSSVGVGNIQKLISFGLCACTDLKKISDMIFSLQYLKKLTLACNIPEFPKDLGQLECLEELCLYSKKIKHLPDSICMLKHLKSLTVDDRGVPIEDLHYEKMITEDLLEKLPADLGQLECLEKLKVSSMKIEYLPDSICKLKRLKLLDLRNCCRIGKLPEDIGQLESLEILNLSYTSIKHLPDSICMLKHLKFLNLFDCFLLEKLPEDLGQLECLETLYVSCQKIKYLPDSICMLKRLKWLYVTECCRLGKLPEDIGQLESLERLDCSGAMIEHLPDSICMLKHLKYLNLHLCAFLEKLPKDLGRLDCLEKLDITHTRISYLPQSIFGLKGLSIVASSELLQLYDFPSEINTTTFHFR